jgi:4-amino-4-deoxy-L-arabinose transferase-like glycosyltransferase
MSEKSSGRWQALAAWLVIALGIVIRLRQYLDQRSLWMDEAMMSLNIAAHNWLPLTQPLDYAQVAPVGFLWLERTAVVIGGVNELTLRAFPMAAGIALLWPLWKVVRSQLTPVESVTAIALAAFSPLLVRYSNEAKQYSIDVFVTVALLALAMRVIESPTKRERWIALGAAGAAALLVSMPVAFALGGVVAALLVNKASRAEARRHAGIVALSLSAWLATFGVTVAIAERSAGSQTYLQMQRFWEFAFLRPGAPDFVARVTTAVNKVLAGFLIGSVSASRWGAWVTVAGSALAVVSLIVTVAGVVGLIQRGKGWLAIVVSVPVVATAIASAAGLYPVSARHLLFAAPGIFLLMAAGLGTVAARLPSRLALSGFIIAASGFVLPSLAQGAAELVSPIRRQDTRQLVRAFEARSAPGDCVYVSVVAIPAWIFYTTDWDAPKRERLSWVAQRADFRGPLFHSALARGPVMLGEGAELERITGQRVELFGMPTGREIRWGGFASTRMNDGWAANEADRVVNACNGRTVWVLYVPLAEIDREPALGALRTALEQRGAGLISVRRTREADLLQFALGKQDR